MSRLSGKALEYDIANTIIDDSEPERAAKEKESRRKRKKEKRVEGRAENTKEVSRSLSSLSLPRDTVPSIPIETSANKPDSGFTKPGSPHHGETHTGFSLDKTIPEVDDDPDFISRPINLCIRQCDPDDSEETDFKQSLDRFKLSTPSLVIQPPNNIDLPQKTSMEVTQVIMGTNAQKLPTPLIRLSTALSKKQLANLNKCYVCDLAWTTRKTVPMKLTHIRSCAKKRGWSEETLIHVFRKELDVVDLPESTLSVPTMVPSKEANSLLEDIIDKAAPRKKAKGSFPKDSILDPIQAHSAIVERAKTLFDPTNKLNEATDGFPSTQQFQPSKFNSISRGVFANAMLEENEKRDIPSTQKFEPGDLGRISGPSSLNTARRLDFHSIQPTSSFHSTSVPLPLASTSENAEFLTVSEIAVNKIGCRPVDLVQLETTNKPESRQTTLSIYDSHSSLSQSSTCYPLTGGTREIINSQTKETNGTPFTDDIDERLRQIIKQNNVLYERILRYEPVHFDTFLSLDGIQEMNVRGFKNRLRVFLDEHSINFYTDSARETNRRRW